MEGFASFAKHDVLVENLKCNKNIIGNEWLMANIHAIYEGLTCNQIWKDKEKDGQGVANFLTQV